MSGEVRYTWQLLRAGPMTPTDLAHRDRTQPQC